MSIPTEAASPDNLGSATAPAGGDSTFKGAIKDGLYTGKLVDMKAKRTPNPFNNGELRDQLVWLFAVEGHESDGVLAYYTSKSLHEKSKFPPTCTALDRPVPGDGETIQKGTYVGATCKLLIKNEASKKDASKKYPRIKELLAC